MAAVTHHHGHSPVEPVIADITEAAAAADAIFKMLKGTKANDMMMVDTETGAPNQDTTVLIPAVARRLLTPVAAGVSKLSRIVLNNKAVIVRIGANKIPTTVTVTDKALHRSGADQDLPILMVIALSLIHISEPTRRS